MNQEDIIQSWQMLNRRVDELEAQTRSVASELIRTKSKTIQQRLGKRYVRQGIFSLLLPFISPMLSYIGLPMWVAVAYAVFGVMMACLNFLFARYISSGDYMSLPIVSAMAHAASVIRWQIRMRYAGYMVTAVVAGPLFYEIIKLNDSDLLTGASIGGIIGLVLGIIKTSSNIRMGRRMAEMLESDIKE